jgi:low affinity Fe/Cu permease
MAEHFVRHSLTKLGEWTAHPTAFLMVPIYGLSWFHFDRQSFDYHAIAVLATWFMTLLIVRTQHRDTLAIHAKLDELLRVEDSARNELIEIDKKDPEEIEKHLQDERPN